MYNGRFMCIIYTYKFTFNFQLIEETILKIVDPVATTLRIFGIRWW